MFEGINFRELFSDDDYGKQFTFGPLTDEMIHRVEEKIGYKLPTSYIAFLGIQNGGFIESDKCYVENVFGISEDPENWKSMEHQFDKWIDEWGYPNVGIPFATTQSGGHEIYFMDYRKTDDKGEPRIICIEQEDDYDEVFIADNFETFIRKLAAHEELSGESLTEHEKTPDQKRNDQLKRQFENIDGNASLCKGGVFFSSIGSIYGFIRGKYILLAICVVVLVLSVVFLAKYKKAEKKIKNEMAQQRVDETKEA